MRDEFRVFYSWQSDRDQKRHRFFLRDVLSRVVKELRADAELEDAPRLDHDTNGEAGTPDIPATILRKITDSSIFVADVTFVAGTNATEPKLVPNPNVMLELGFAAKSLGWDRIVLVMNDAHGSADKHIFDLRHRRNPISYQWKDEDAELPAEKKKTLSEALKVAIRAAIAAEHDAVGDAIGSLDLSCLNLMGLFGKNDYFSAPPPTAFIPGGVLDSAAFAAAVRELIRLKLLRCDVNPGASLYAYHWTHLGKLVLKKLQYRPEQTG